MTSTVLVVEDDPSVNERLVRALRSSGYEARGVSTVATAVAAIDAARPDLVLLDLGLPDGDGTEVAAHVARFDPSILVIALSGRDDEHDVVHGLEAGAVDYVVKPFAWAELLARVRSHLRVRESMPPGEPRPPATLTVGDLVVDRRRRSVTLSGREVSLRPREFDVLARLAVDAGAVVARERMIDDVWDQNWWGSTKTLDVHVNSIRRKLGEPRGSPSRITAIRGVGYRLDAHAKPR